MSLQCPACQQTVPAGDVNIGVDLARCTACGEVFRPSAAMAPGPTAAADETLPPKPEGPPAGTKVRLEDQGGSLLVRFPPAGFNVGLLFLIAFAIAWWSFLAAFIGFGVWGAMQSDHQEQPQQTAIEAENPLESKPSTAETPSSKHGDSKEHDPGFMKWGGIFIGLFMLPFFAAGLGMILAILWPLFGRNRVRLAMDGCSYRASLLGLGRTHTALLPDTYVRWMDEPLSSGRGWPGWSAMPDMSMKNVKPHILLALGNWETPIGGHLSLREQEWVFHEMNAWLKRYGEREPRPRGR